MTRTSCLSCLLALISLQSEASYSIYVGKNHTTDGSVLIGGSGDEVSSDWLELVPRVRYEPGATLQAGVERANLRVRLFSFVIDALIL